MLPEPLAVQVPPTRRHRSGAGERCRKVSATVAPVALLDPLLVVIVYVTEPPGVAVVTPSVTVIEPSTCGASVKVGRRVIAGVGSVTPLGAATVAVLLSVPVADAEMAQLAV